MIDRPPKTDDEQRIRGAIETEAFDKIEIANIAELDTWLEANHAQDQSVWLVTFKKGAPGYVAMPQVLDTLIRHGWIDGIRRKLDERRTMQLISKRRQQIWAKTYKDRVQRLTDDGLMRPWGIEAVDLAKRGSTWDAMADVDALIVPEDLRSALDLSSVAAQAFDDSPPSYRRNILRWLALAKTPATREKRIAAITEASTVGARIPNM